MPPKLDRRAFAAGLMAACGASATPACAQSARYGRVARRESQYNTIFIDREGTYVSMRFGINDQLFHESRYNTADPLELPFAYTRYMNVALAYAPRLTKILEIGLGGGTVAQYLHRQINTAVITCVELDPEVIALARRYFGLREDSRLRVVERDGRIFLRATRDAYDVIMIDAYRGTFVPFHLTTREFFAIVKRKLAPGGVMVQNVSPEVLRPADMIATIRSAFANVDQYNADGSIVLAAYDGPPKTAAQLTARATALQTAHRLRYPLGPMLAGRRAGVTGQGGQILTDNFAPVEFMRGIQQNNSRRN